MPSHYLNQCWNIVDWTARNKLQWNVNRNSQISIQENPFENVVWKMAAILSRPQSVNSMRPGTSTKCQWPLWTLFQVVTWHRAGTKPQLNKCHIIVNWTTRNRLWKRLWNWNRNKPFPFYIKRHMSMFIFLEYTCHIIQASMCILNTFSRIRCHLLSHRGRVTHICVSKIIIIGSDNGLLPGRCQAIIWTNAEILLIGLLGTNFNEIEVSKSRHFHWRKSLKNVVCKMVE